MGGGHHPHVHLDRPVAAHPLELVLLEKAQELHLHGGRDVADLVEEEGASVRGLEAAGPGGDGARERALLVAEQLALEEGLGQGRARHLHEGRRLRRAVLVDGLGEELLARPALSEQEHGGARGRYLAHALEHREHLRALPHEVVEPVLLLEALPQDAGLGRRLFRSRARSTTSSSSSTSTGLVR